MKCTKRPTRKRRNPSLLKIGILLLLVTLAWGQAGVQQLLDKAEQNLKYTQAVDRYLRVSRVPTVTVGQCSAAEQEWESNDRQSFVGAVQPTGHWAAQLSTEELIRLNALAVVCGHLTLERLKKTKNESAKMELLWSESGLADHALQFDFELRARAEGILLDHRLIDEYLLRKSK